jgi:site-specific recombinase XerD
MLLGFVCASSGKLLENITFTDLNRAAVTGFLDEMEKTRGWISSTRNHRLGCIRSFFRFAASLEPILVIYSEELKGIPLKKSADKSRVMEFMSQEAMAAVLRQPGTITKMGVRDTFFMVLMYDTAARDCEMLSMRFCDINPEKRTVLLFGKGSKQRLVPISEETVGHFNRYARAFHSSGDGTAPMFYTIRRNERTPMSDDNVARFMQKYGVDAKNQCPDLPEKNHSSYVPKVARHAPVSFGDAIGTSCGITGACGSGNGLGVCLCRYGNEAKGNKESRSKRRGTPIGRDRNMGRR